MKLKKQFAHRIENHNWEKQLCGNFSGFGPVLQKEFYYNLHDFKKDNAHMSA